MDSFKQMGLNEHILESLESIQYTTPTDVQLAVIPKMLAKKDVVIQSRTGSGKTAAFGIPLVQSVLTDVPAAQFLILVPTRELAMQVQRELARLAEGSEINVVAIYGGAQINPQIKSLKTAHIIVGTPGRVLDHLKRRTMTVSVVRCVVLDEADKMLSMGFLPEVNLIFKHLPKRRQSVLASATFPSTIERLIYQYMIDPIKVSLSSDSVSPDEVEHFYCIAPIQEKDQVLLAFLEKERPDQSLIFCNTKIEVRSLEKFLTGAGMNATSLSSDLSQNQRERALRGLRLGLVNHLVCTDVAARGIDIPHLSHVFVYSTSDDAETYVHRTGRTGRAGNPGTAISLISGHDVANFNQAMRSNGIEAAELAPPTEEEILNSHLKKNHQTLESIDYAREADIPEEYISLAESLTADQVKSLLPLLLEKFLRAEVYDISQELADPIAPPPKDDSPPQRTQHRRERSSHGPQRRDRSHSNGPHRSHGSQTTVCLAFGKKDGMILSDIKQILKRQGRARYEDIGRIQMGDHESLINIGSRSLRGVLGADGKHFRHREIFIAKSKQTLDEHA